MKINRHTSHVTRHMSKILLLVNYFLVIATLAGCAKKEIKNIDSEGKKVICFGDSITFGYGAGPGEDYPSALSKMLAYPVLNSGIDGDTSTEALKRLKSDALNRDPLLVIIEFGGNDFLRKIPQEETVNNIREMIDQIQAHGAMVALVDISAGMLMSEYRRDFARLAREKGTIFIPGVFSGIITNSKYKSDFIHPNAEGYKLIATRICRSIIPHLQKNSLLRQEKKP